MFTFTGCPLAVRVDELLKPVLKAKYFFRAPRVALVILRRLCEKDRARPPPELARLFALDKFIFWRVLSFWRCDRDLCPHITTRKTTAPYYYW